MPEVKHGGGRVPGEGKKLGSAKVERLAKQECENSSGVASIPSLSSVRRTAQPQVHRTPLLVGRASVSPSFRWSCARAAFFFEKVVRARFDIFTAVSIQITELRLLLGP